MIMFSTKLISASGKNMILENTDPTIIIRLYSILTGKDIFSLKNEFNYVINRISSNQVEMIISKDFSDELKKVSNHQSQEVIGDWYLSTEVALNGWGIKETEKQFSRIKAFCDE